MNVFANYVFVSRNRSKEKPFSVTVRDENGRFRTETNQMFFSEKEALDAAYRLSKEFGVHYDGKIYDAS